MTPKEKAIELVKKFEDLVMFDYRGDEEPIFELQKQCALIAVDEIYKNINSLFNQGLSVHDNVLNSTLDYWGKIQEEIEKL